MAKRLTYSDALKILGKNDSEVLDLAEKVADGGLGLVGVPDVFGVRGALVNKGRKALEGLGGKLRGESRLSRTEKIEAAYKILVITTFFEAVEESLKEVEAPFTLADLEITADEQFSIFGKELDSVGQLSPTLRLNVPADSLGTHDETPFFVLTDTFVEFVLGLAVAERHGLTPQKYTVLGKLYDLVPSLARRGLDDALLRLGSEMPEFGLWMHVQEHTRTRQEIGTGLAGLHKELSKLGSGRAVTRRRQELAASYQAVLSRPVLRSDDVPAGLTLPSLRDAYIPPRGRIAYVDGSHDLPSRDDWWEPRQVQNDLQPFVASLLTHPVATQRPVVVLGHPGAGKSKFTEMLAAQLPAEDFLPIRVELRAVSPNAPLHAQIEEGLAADLHTSMSWRELSDESDGALPVIILDGFDELLQATGVDRSDYLERVQEFQEKQENMGQPVAVIVTSRTLVAGRTRFPLGTTVIRLEPFDDGQIEQMLRVWNRANTSAFSSSGLSPLTPEAVIRYRDLAEQPLLLLMLLIYDAHANALLKASDTLSHGDLYERLLTMFARREVDKHRPNLGGRDLDRAIEDELRRLEVAAMAMFARGRQSVRAEELDLDLAVLMPEAAETPNQPDLHGQIAPAHQVLGRFFFVHEARSKTAEGTNSAFEFLHATFGEYLVARMVVAALEELVDDRARVSRRRSRALHLDDGELYALASFAAYAGRDKVVAFLEELLERRLAEEPGLREEFWELLLELFQEAPFPASNRSFAEYEPVRLPVTSREARYTANLITLLVLVSEEPVPLESMYPDTGDPWHGWRRTVSLWRALSATQWFGIIDFMRMRHIGYWKGEQPYSVLSRDRGEPVNVGECVGFELRADSPGDPATLNPYEVEVPYGTVVSRLLRSTSMRANGTASRLALLLTPYLQYVSDDLGTWYSDDDQKSWVETHEVLRLRLEAVDQLPAELAADRLSSYSRLLARTEPDQVVITVLRQALEDLRSWPPHLGPHPRLKLATMVQTVLRDTRRNRDTPQVVWDSFQRLRSELLPLLDDEGPDVSWPQPRPSPTDPTNPFQPGWLSGAPGGSAGP
ncbi:NACHT domain-containing protein [Nocardiopsis ganjiahuensis]|uniref:NACHT domain-containing protein n=1 Tax=Nocardiopsis ganjiahuensis TaxID=239984 RepID=UPI00034D4C7E|nr:ATP-binding protein [Nocardiopsis ganjiahuensis]